MQDTYKDSCHHQLPCECTYPCHAGKRASSCPALKLENPKCLWRAVHRLEYATHPSLGADKLAPARGHAALHRNLGGAPTTAVISTVYTHFPTSLVPRPLPDFISQPWRKIGRRPGSKIRHGPEMVDSVCTNRVHHFRSVT